MNKNDDQDQHKRPPRPGASFFKVNVSLTFDRSCYPQAKSQEFCSRQRMICLSQKAKHQEITGRNPRYTFS